MPRFGLTEMLRDLLTKVGHRREGGRVKKHEPKEWQGVILFHLEVHRGLGRTEDEEEAIEELEEELEELEVEWVVPLDDVVVLVVLALELLEDVIEALELLGITLELDDEDVELERVVDDEAELLGCELDVLLLMWSVEEFDGDDGLAGPEEVEDSDEELLKWEELVEAELLKTLLEVELVVRESAELLLDDDVECDDELLEELEDAEPLV
ncbi:hypothetical protein DFH07DRAFT_766895 [Mycena maculata]|uniref:Uncharacterized protein n=1 Tax=Mycena maculata TaxID=230809 RepID=A0AAD7K545_9AGAR|nr:hypothetical protein DFH07DRAFT_766895 [Mycena maculata]